MGMEQEGVNKVRSAWVREMYARSSREVAEFSRLSGMILWKVWSGWWISWRE